MPQTVHRLPVQKLRREIHRKRGGKFAKLAQQRRFVQTGYNPNQFFDLVCLHHVSTDSRPSRVVVVAKNLRFNKKNRSMFLCEEYRALESRSLSSEQSSPAPATAKLSKAVSAPAPCSGPPPPHDFPSSSPPQAPRASATAPAHSTAEAGSPAGADNAASDTAPAPGDTNPRSHLPHRNPRPRLSQPLLWARHAVRPDRHPRSSPPEAA
jgi:hypothetical protein